MAFCWRRVRRAKRRMRSDDCGLRIEVVFMRSPGDREAWNVLRACCRVRRDERRRGGRSGTVLAVCWRRTRRAKRRMRSDDCGLRSEVVNMEVSLASVGR